MTYSRVPYPPGLRSNGLFKNLRSIIGQADGSQCEPPSYSVQYARHDIARLLECSYSGVNRMRRSVIADGRTLRPDPSPRELIAGGERLLFALAEMRLTPEQRRRISRRMLQI